MSPYCYALLAVLLPLGAHSQHVVTSLSDLPYFPSASGFCAATSTSPSVRYNHFVSSIQNNLAFDPATGWSMTTYELCNPDSSNGYFCGSTYQIEAVRTVSPS